jgi:uncharacterized phage protein (TIGR02220 family)
MASRIRTVKPELFRHRDLFNLEDRIGLPVRLFWVGLFTVADRDGRFRWIPELLKLDILPYDNLNIEIILNGLWREGFIKKYEIDSKCYGFIPTWDDHQHINHRESPSRLPMPDQQRLIKIDASTPPGIPGNFTGTPRHTQGEGNRIEGKGREVSSPTCTVITVRRSSPNEVAEIIDYLNKVAHKKFSPESLDTKKLITFKIKSGYTVTDFKHVINVKTEQWLNDPTQDMYLRPKTLFGSKFEGYLNEKPREILLSNTKPPVTFADLLAEEDACHE